MANFTPQQQQAIETLDRNVSVSAGAGSGKTRVLVERFLKILEDRKQKVLAAKQLNQTLTAPVLEILAITFTRKAAREMRERVQKGIRERLDEATDPESKAYWQQQLQLADRAPITTIDSFCSQVLRENPVEAGLDPNFQVQEEFQIRAFQQQATETFVAREVQQGSEKIRGLLELYPAWQLSSKLLRLLDALPDILKEGDLGAPYEKSLQGETDLQIAAESALDALLQNRDQAGARTRQTLDALNDDREALHHLIAHKDYGTFRDRLGGLAARGKIADLVKELKNAVASLLTLALDEAGARQARWWQALLTRYREFLQTQQEQQEMYSFGYLSAKAVDLLERDPVVRRRYQEQFRYLMVDEFQDTNDEQKRLVYLLCGGDSKELKGKNLFVVGDAKQSIYRFRGADVSVFHQVREDIAKTGGVNIVMDDNFRSAPEIITACNTLFDDLLGHSDQSDVTAQPLKAHQPASAKPEFLVLKKGDCSQPQCQQGEGRVVAEKIRQLVADHPELHYGDVAILVPAIHLSRQYEEALTALGIKSQVSDGKGFYDRPEVVDLINLLTFLLNPRKEWALAGFLRSPFVGLTDARISDLMMEHWPELKLRMSLHERLEYSALDEKLDHLQRLADALGLPELLDAIQEAFVLEPTLLRQKGGREKLANVRKLRAMAVNDAMEKGSTARDFLARLNLMRTLSARESAANQEDDRDAVKIMTIHKSKGLEFPAVFLPDLSRKDPSDTLGLQFLPKVGFGVKVPDGQGGMVATSVYAQAREERRKLELAEKHRQLYVAMTRAEKYLCLVNVDETKEDGKKSGSSGQEKWGQSIQRVFAPDGPNGDQMDSEELDVAEVLAADLAAGSGEQAKAFTLDPAVYDRVQPVVVHRELRLSASALLEYDNCPRSFFYHYRLQMPGIEPEVAGTGTGRISAIRLGTYVHRVLELQLKGCPLEEALDEALAVLGDDNWKELREDEEGEDTLTQAMKTTFRREGKKLVDQYCASPLYQGMAEEQAQAEVRFELPLYTFEDGTVVFQGSIDRLVDLGGDQLGIVDYKTGHPPTGGEERQGYTRQLTIYAKAAETLYPGRKVAWARLHFLQDCSSWELQDRPREEKKLEQLLEKLVQYKEERDFPVHADGCAFCPYSYFCKKE